MADAQDSPKKAGGWMFEQRTSGLLVPTGLVLDSKLFSFRDLTTPDEGHRALRGIGTVPTYGDLWDGPTPDLESLLRAVPVQLWFAFLTRLITVILRDNAAPREKTGIMLAMLDDDARRRALSYLQRNDNASPISAFSVLLLLELAASRAELAASPLPQIDPATLRIMVRALYVVSDRLNEELTVSIPENPAGVAAALRERSILGQPMRRMLTAFGLWVWSHTSLNDSARLARANFNTCFQSQYGLSLDDWVAGLSLATFAAVVQPLPEAVTGPIFITGTRNDLTPAGQALLGSGLSYVSLTTEAFREECRKADAQEDLLQRPSLLPLKRHPCLRTVDGAQTAWRVMSPLHLAEAALHRPLLERAGDSAQRDIARIEYGHLVEGYVHGLLVHVFGDRYQRLEPSATTKRAEGIVWYPRGFIVIECKARWSSELIRYQLRSDDAYESEMLNSGLRKASEQIDSTIDDVLSGSISHRCDGEPKIAGGIILSLQDLALSWISGSVFERVLPPSRTTGSVLRLRPQLMAIETLEELDKWGHVDVLAVLAKKMQDPHTMFECINEYLLHERVEPQTPKTKRIIWNALRASIAPYLNAPDGNAVG